MILAVDIGNSNIVLGCFDENEILFEDRLSTDRDSTVLEYAVIIKTSLEMHHLEYEQITGAIISSVVPSVTENVQQAIFRLIGQQAMVVSPGMKTGLNILLDDPKQLGSDRVADAVGAIGEYPCPLIIVDMGTATTISVIDGQKNFMGGMIIPGLQVSLDSLANRTSQLPHISLEAPKKVIGTNTVDCMKSGIIYSTAGSIDGAIERIEEELGETCTVVSTGGHARKIIPYCHHEILIDPHLLLKGLMTIYKKNL
ncbi:MAG: type III pantothenate kinase [Oscillospiraceae bacterium]|nr:type III pantothenate kinase [Oscillospiraceae bacterium]MBQ5699257.1 type III pantothenate kinase [Lachnospiraceae bacterium]